MKAAHRQHLTRSDIIACGLILSAGVVILYNYYLGVHVPNFDSRLELHRSIIDGTAFSPFRYRVLVPFSAELLIQLLRSITGEREAFRFAYLFIEGGAIAFSLLMLYLLIRQWFTREAALAGALLTAALIPAALRDHAYQPWSFLEFGLLALALALLVRKRYALFVLVTALMTLNRETGLLAPLAFTVTMFPPGLILRRRVPRLRPAVWWLSGAWLAWLVIFTGLRLIRGAAPLIDSIETILAANLDPANTSRLLINNLLVFGLAWIFALAGLRRAPGFLRRVAWIALPYAGLVLVFNRWWEVRLWMTLYPLVIPLALSALSETSVHDVDERQGADVDSSVGLGAGGANTST
ncbi:MAG: hypothetical protein IT326_09075 [Anaerolineae bacterium]|nr:hypothetical protein [Anaerolineae bacterium]